LHQVGGYVHPAAIELGYHAMHLAELYLSAGLQRFADPACKAFGSVYCNSPVLGGSGGPVA
jgi:hypothetical protein